MARGRRTDRTREQLVELVLTEGSRLVVEIGYAGFSARELARRIGYSASAVLMATGGSDRLMLAINTRTFGRWADALERDLARAPTDRIAALVGAYFSFARANPLSWSAIYEHKLPTGESIPDDQAATRERLTRIVADEIAAAIPGCGTAEVQSLTRSLVATVHGHCTLELAGSYGLMGGVSAESDALERVREALERRNRGATPLDRRNPA